MLEIRNMTKTYNPGTVTELKLFQGFDLTVPDGQFISIVTKSTPLANEAWGLSNLMTSKSLQYLGELGGPRCCKRNSYLSIKAAIEFSKEHLGVEMEGTEDLTCTHFTENKQCIGKRCPFAPVNARKKMQELESLEKGE